MSCWNWLFLISSSRPLLSYFKKFSRNIIYYFFIFFYSFLNSFNLIFIFLDFFQFFIRKVFKVFSKLFQKLFKISIVFPQYGPQIFTLTFPKNFSTKFPLKKKIGKLRKKWKNPRNLSLSQTEFENYSVLKSFVFSIQS